MTLNPATAQARVLVDELARCGVTEGVVAPGSRSAPLALALHADERIRLHVRIDERSASFLALGLAKASGRPVPVVCTSGTAAAAFHPAVAEADLAHVGLLVLTADRPPELRGTGANQTIDQINLFGSAVRLFVEVGVAEPIPGQVAYWRSLVGRAYGAAVDGPVHLNVPFREPLVPRPGDDGTWPEPLDGRVGGHPWVRVDRGERSAPDLAVLLGSSDGVLPERGAVVAGDGVVPSQMCDVVGLAAGAGWPLLAEPTSGARQGPVVVDAYPLLLADREFAAEAPEVVVTVGKPGLSRSTLAWLARAGRHVVVDPRGRWADPTRTAAVVLPSVPTTEHERRESAWLERWRAAAAAAVAACDEVLAATEALSEPRVARDLAAAVPPGGLLFTGPSRAVRDLDAYARPHWDVRVLGNRGVNGIDGVVSTALGAALAHQRIRRGPAYALLGDLSYLYDRNGLVLGPDEPRPDLTLVVVDNDGGGIFSMLPQAGVDGFERVFGTPHGVDIAADAAAVGLPYACPATPAELAAALTPSPGLRLVRVRTDRAATAALHVALQKAVSAALPR